MIAAERLADLGYEVEFTHFAGGALDQAFVENEFDISAGPVASTMPMLEQGLDIKYFATRTQNEFVFVAREDLKTCESLDGERVAVHSAVDTTSLLVDQWLGDNCPEANPQIELVEGSENRLAGLLQGQLSATALDIQDTVLLMNERPGEFHVLVDFIEEYPVLGGMHYGHTAFLEENRQLVEDFIAELMGVWAQIYDDPEFLLDEAADRLPEVDPEILPAIVDRYVELEVFPLEDPLNADAVEFSLRFFAEGADFPNVGGSDEVADLSYLEAVLN